MHLQELWDKALKSTEVLRSRVVDLPSFEATALPYVFLAESSVNAGDTVVRKGQVLIERPSLIWPSAQFEGFEFQQDWSLSEDAVMNFLLVRGIKFPSMRYHHELSSLDLREGSLQSAITHYTTQMKQAEDVQTGLVAGPEDAWQFSVLILVGSLMARSAEGDLRRLLEAWRQSRNN
jgi:hypothetical protein